MIEVVSGNWDFKLRRMSQKKYQLDDKKTMEIIIDDIVFAVQNGPFQKIKEDWNHDGDVYELFGAYFKVDGYLEFFTPETIISIIEENNGEIRYI